MDLAESAFLLKKKGNEEEAVKQFCEALKLEQEAADAISIGKENEPTRSILYRSAAALAQHSRNHELAERLIANGLAGYPPPEIREELKNLYEDIDFMRHLSTQGLSLSEDHWFMSISGNATRYGGTAADLLMNRVDRVSTLFYRTVERLLKLPYRTNGGVSKDIKCDYGLYINSFPARSFAVSFQIGQPDPRIPLSPDMKKKKAIEPAKVVDEILTCFELYEGDKEEDLKNMINDDTYYDNFIGLAKQLSPDGNDIKLVGFNAIRGNKERPVALRKTRKRTSKQETDDTEGNLERKELVIVGVLTHANTPKKGNFGAVKVRNLSSQEESIVHVPISIMKDVVQPFYEEDVEIQAHQESNKIILDEISINK